MKFKIVFLSVMMWCFGAKADLTSATALDEPIGKIQKKYQLDKESCSAEDSKMCQEKFKSNCECYKARIVQYAQKSQTMFFTVNKGVVVEFADQRRTSSSAYYESFYGFVQAFAGDEKPDEVYEAKPTRDTQGVALIWKKGGAVYRVNAVCPLTMFGGKLQMKTPLKKCYSGTIVASKLSDQQPKGIWKKTEIDY